MPLKDKYLKYTPEITLEIFTLVCNKLIECGINPSHKESIETKYNNFSKTENYLQLDGGGYCFECYKEDYGLIETTVQEILGYDPFVKDDFILERNWQIKTTDEVIEELQKHDILYGINYSYTPDAYYGMNNGTRFGQIDVKQNVQIITLEQLKQYVLKTTEQPKVMETKVESKEVIPEYVECIVDRPERFAKGRIYEVDRVSGYNIDFFKPSTKEAYDAQNKPKSIEKWSVGSYVVFLEDYLQNNGYKKGQISKILDVRSNTIYFENACVNDVAGLSSVADNLKWFTTKSEAEEFAKTLVEPVKEEVKQQLKQAVHCKTQEGWDFVLSKINYKQPKDSFRPGCNSVVTTDEEDKSNIGCVGSDFLLKNVYQLLSFQEWCGLNGYKMEKEVKSNQEFKVGDWLYFKGNPPGVITSFWTVGKIFQIAKFSDWDKNSVEMSRGESNYIQACRHATPEEINNHLISIGQISAGEPLNIGIKPDKDGMFKYTTHNGSTVIGKNPVIPGPLKMTLSIDDEELPMVSIIKTKKVNLLNND